MINEFYVYSCSFDQSALHKCLHSFLYASKPNAEVPGLSRPKTSTLFVRPCYFHTYNFLASAMGSHHIHGIYILKVPERRGVIGGVVAGVH